MLDELRTEVRRLAAASGRDDILSAIDDHRVPNDAPVRVLVAGETKRGKSTLVNTLIGRPLLSPVGTDVTTACWVEFAWGPKDDAVALIADPAAPGTPRRVRFDVREVERYVSVNHTTDAVLGVEIRVPSPLLEGLVLVDTPGVGGLRAGHSAITLAALRHADALLFVCDATQPVLAPEVEFLAAAVVRVPTVAVAVTKCDANPGFADVVEETRERLAEHPALAHVPVFAVAAPLADRAAETEDPAVAAKLTEISGIDQLVRTIKANAAVGGEALRTANAARRISAAAQVLAWQARESTLADRDGGSDLRARIEQLSRELADGQAVSDLIRARLAGLRTDSPHSFRVAARKIHAGYRTEAERGPATQLSTLAPRMVADLTACATETFESVAVDTRALLRGVLGDLGVDLPPAVLDLELAAPDLTRRDKGVQSTYSVEVFKTVVGLAVAVPAVLSVLSGAGLVAAGIVLAASAGWWRLRGETEQQRRTQLRTWVDTALDDAVEGFDAEIHRRIRSVEAHLDAVVPHLLRARRDELVRLEHERTDEHAATERHRVETQLRLESTIAQLTGLAARADRIAEGVRP
ncbi:dynamin family protein [Lentzea sp. NPDC051213]|uniref:dynamin family protein n=1 Tax=Lentzea sp. NPDC051213 TaxID=3364126 RepID=UPI00379AADBC